MKRVLIAGNCDADSVKNPLSYLKAVRQAGAVATVGAALDDGDAEALAEAFDALLLPGGGDIPAAHFGQAAHPAVSLDHPARDLSDELLLKAFIQRQKRVLGICRGCQAANIFLGGTIHQHLPDAFDPVLWHSGNITGRHPAKVESGTLLGSLIGSGTVPVNSSHHQAVDVPGQGLRIAAKAPDGVVEALEGDGILLLQWHPERMLDTMLPVFDWLISNTGSC